MCGEKSNMMPDKQYLWINLADLADLGKIGSFGSPLNLMVKPELGDKLLPGAWCSEERVDETYIVVFSSPVRCVAIKDALNILAERKLRRRMRCRITAHAPQK